MVYVLLYPFLRFALWVVLRLLPVEAFNRLCLILPGTLIIRGLRYYGAQIGNGVTFTPPIAFHNFADKSNEPFSNLFVGKDCYFGREIFVDLKDRVVIEDCVTLSMGVAIVTHTDVARSPLKANLAPNTQGPVIIHEGAYLGARSTILQGVEIGQCAIVAAGAVVNKPIPQYTIYGGVPAREIRRLSPLRD